MPKCKNNPKKSYTGEEPSPKGKGWCAGGMKVGKIKMGGDGNKWIVTEDKNGHTRWGKFTKSTPKKTPKRSPKKTLKKTPKRSPKKTLKKTPKKTPKISPKKTPKETPKKSNFFKKLIGNILFGKIKYIDPTKYVYLTVTPWYYTEETLEKAYNSIDYEKKEFKLKKNDVSDAAIEKIFKKYIQENFYLFTMYRSHRYPARDTTSVKLVNTKKIRNKIEFTLKYDIENVDIKDESEFVKESIHDATSAGAPVFFKTINKQKIYVYLYYHGMTFTQ